MTSKYITEEYQSLNWGNFFYNKGGAIIVLFRAKNPEQGIKGIFSRCENHSTNFR